MVAPSILPDEARAAAWRALWDALILEASGEPDKAETDPAEDRPDDKPSKCESVDLWAMKPRPSESGDPTYLGSRQSA